MEEKFYKCFGIEDKNDLPLYYKAHPDITDRVLLELICIIAGTINTYCANETNINSLKENILHRAINLKDYIGDQVRKLFEEGE